MRLGLLRRERDDVAEDSPRFLANLSSGLTAEFVGAPPAGTTGVVVQWHGLSIALPAPRGFDRLEWEYEEREDHGEVVADALVCFAGEVQLTVLLYRKTKVARVDLRHVGRRRMSWQPKQGG